MILGYTRVSTVEQAEGDRTSMQEQENIIYGYAMTKGVDRFGVQIFADPGISARNPFKTRPAGRELMDAVRPGDTVIASKMDRIFRSARDALESVEYFKTNNINLVLFDMGIQPVNEDAASKMFLTMLAAFAEFERMRIRERMILGKEAKKRHGGHAGGEAPYGYKIVGKGRASKLEPDPDEQPILDMIKAKVHSPFFSAGGMTKYLNSSGFVARAGKPFRRYQIERIADRLRAQ